VVVYSGEPYPLRTYPYESVHFAAATSTWVTAPTLREGELRVLNFLDDHLHLEWEIYVQPHLNGLRPDFVLLHPSVGIAVFEVKDWDLRALTYAVRLSHGTPVLSARDREGKEFRVRDNPIEKIEEYKDEILNLYCPSLGRRLQDCPGAAATVTGGVVMTSTTTEEAAELFRPFREHLGMLGNCEQYYPLSGFDALDRGEFRVVFPWAGHSRSRWMTEELAAELRTWLEEPEYALVQREPLPLNTRQLEVVRNPHQTRYRHIRGPAGSGKSLALAARAAHLSAQGKDVLVVTYNMTLWHYLRDLAVRYPEPKKSVTNRITWLHFHE
jgi:hypothetical protein